MHYIRYWVFILKVYVFLRLDEMMLNHWVTNDLKMSNQAIWKFRCSNYLIQYWHLFFQYPHRRRLYRFSNRVVRPGKARYRRSIKYFFLNDTRDITMTVHQKKTNCVKSASLLKHYYWSVNIETILVYIFLLVQA